MNVKSAQIDGEGQLYAVMWCDLLWVNPNVGLAIVVAQYALMSPTEYVYSGKAAGSTGVCQSVPTLYFPTTLSHIEREATQVTTAVSLPITVHETSVGGFGSAKSTRKVHTIGESACDGVQWLLSATVGCKCHLAAQTGLPLWIYSYLLLSWWQPQTHRNLNLLLCVAV